MLQNFQIQYFLRILCFSPFSLSNCISPLLRKFQSILKFKLFFKILQKSFRRTAQEAGDTEADAYDAEGVWSAWPGSGSFSAGQARQGAPWRGGTFAPRRGEIVENSLAQRLKIW